MSLWPFSIVQIQGRPTVNVSGLAKAATAKTEYNIDLTVVNTEYSQALPASTKAIEFQCRQDHDIRYAFTIGKVAAPIAPYFTLKAGQPYYKEFIDLTGVTVYFAGGTAGDDVELIAWS